MDYLEVHPDEFEQLFNTILINVTAFFRDPPAWEYLRETVLPALLAGSRPTSRSASGAPAARGPGGLLARHGARRRLGADAYRERVKIYATDVDEEALAQARQAIYSAKEIESVPDELRERYFERAGPALRLPQGPAAHGDLRAQRPDPGRADLAHRPAGVPQHADVLQRRDAGADPAPLPLRARRRRRAVPRQVRDDALAPRPVRRGRPQAPIFLKQPCATMPAAQARSPIAEQEAPRRASEPRGPGRGARGRPARPVIVSRDRPARFVNEPARALFRISRDGHRPPVRRPRALVPAGRPASAPIEQVLRDRRRGAGRRRGVRAGATSRAGSTSM